MVIAYLTAVAAQVREILAQLGARSIQEIVGRVDLLRPKPTDHPKAARVNLEFILRDPDPQGARSRRNVTHATTGPRTPTSTRRSFARSPRRERRDGRSGCALPSATPTARSGPGWRA